jgi:hypothetical protein
MSEPFTPSDASGRLRQIEAAAQDALELLDIAASYDVDGETVGMRLHGRACRKAAASLRESLRSPVQWVQEVEAAFKAGYHCRWHRDTGRYNFDPAMAPGDPDGAYTAWLAALRSSVREGVAHR